MLGAEEGLPHDPLDGGGELVQGNLSATCDIEDLPRAQVSLQAEEVRAHRVCHEGEVPRLLAIPEYDWGFVVNDPVHEGWYNPAVGPMFLPGTVDVEIP